MPAAGEKRQLKLPILIRFPHLDSAAKPACKEFPGIEDPIARISRKAPRVPGLSVDRHGHPCRGVDREYIGTCTDTERVGPLCAFEELMRNAIMVV